MLRLLLLASVLSPIADAACGGTILSKRGSIRSPNYPKKYPNNAHCLYNLLASSDAILKISCPTFNINNSPGCLKDYLEINGVKYCGENSPRNLRGIGQLSLIFHSDGSKSKKRGFLCKYLRISGSPYTGTTAANTPSPNNGSGCYAEGSIYNYDEVLHKSLLFYEAQRSGYLPTSQRVTWRSNSATDDAIVNATLQHVDLEGGYYDAGDNLKLGFPMASMTTVLAWGAIEYGAAYENAGEMSYMLEAVKWATDYFIKAHTAPYVFYGHVGDTTLDHNEWIRPEDMTMYRPAYAITSTNPGSDLAGETAAALAAASILFNATNPAYASTCLLHAEQLYDFANQFRGKYDKAITDAASSYPSDGGFVDELAWAAVWLYRATANSTYLVHARNHYNNLSGGVTEFSWAEKSPGVQVLLSEYAELNQRNTYLNDLQVFCDYVVNDAKRSPKGLVILGNWGSLRYAANAAFICLRAADLGLKTTMYREFAKQQIHYILGNGGRSYVVGFGNNPPVRPHHAGSSCPLPPKPCGWTYFDSPDPNPNELTGALVGGPDAADNYVDDRSDYVKNEVATDYNAGFQSAVAALRTLASCGTSTTSTPAGRH